MARSAKTIAAIATAALAFGLGSAGASATEGGAGACEGIEASVRLSLAGSGWSQEEINLTAKEAAAECWESLHRAEAEEAQIDAEIQATLEQEKARKEARETEQHERELERRVAEEQREWERRKARREWAHKPTVNLFIASRLAARTLRNAGYVNGWVKCKGGRIDRTHWGCEVHLFVHCLESRMQVWGAGYRNGHPLYSTRSGRFHQCPL